MWHLTCDMWHLTHDSWHVTHGGRWTFSQHFWSLANTVWEWRCPQLVNEWVNEIITVTPGLSTITCFYVCLWCPCIGFCVAWSRKCHFPSSLCCPWENLQMKAVQTLVSLHLSGSLRAQHLGYLECLAQIKLRKCLRIHFTVQTC